jgi:hypothetical protein
MATTTNFGWETPDDTDLVKDGAAAIRTALGGVDTSFVDLKGGTTGQVLSKASDTDLDFSWIAAGSAPNYALINAGGTALTGATTITVSGISGKNNLLIQIDGASSANASAEFTLRFNADTAANYAYAGLSVENTNVAGATSDMARTSLEIAGQGNNASNTVRAIITVAGANAAGIKPVQINSEANGATTDKQYALNALYKGTSTISSVSIISSSGNFDAGTIYVYGA